MHQFLAQHFDYGRNLVIIDMLAVKQAHCGFMILLCNEAERARVEKSKVVADDGKTSRSNHKPTDLLFFDDIAGGMMHFPAHVMDSYINDTISKKWLFAGATIYDVSLLHEDYAKRLVDLDLGCTWQEKKYNNFRCLEDLRDVNVASCTASSALAQAVVVYTAGCTDFLDVFKDAGLLSLPDVAAAAETGDGPKFEYNMTEDRNKFMAYCMVMRLFQLRQGCIQLASRDRRRRHHWTVVP